MIPARDRTAIVVGDQNGIVNSHHFQSYGIEVHHPACVIEPRLSAIVLC